MQPFKRWMLACLAGTAAFLVPATAPAQEVIDFPAPVVPAVPPGPISASSPEEPAACCYGFDWTAKPPVTKFPRPGYFTIPPTGPGYYSFADWLHDEHRAAPPKYPYPRFGLMQFPFFDADWRYLDKPDNTEHDLFDPLKRVHLGDHWLFTTGGDFRFRHANEVGSRLSGTNNSYYLYRTRVYGDLWYEDQFRLYAEYLDAHSFRQDLPPLPIDVDRSDLLNLFVDVKVGEVEGAPVYVRAGRQELLYGSQRLISPLEWANTRRTFQGVKAFRHGEKLDVDAFVVQPVVPDPSNFDSVDNNQVFAGLWGTYRPKEGRSVDLYYLLLDNTNAGPIRQGIPAGPYNVHTIGARHVGSQGGWLWDAEGMAQFGDRRGQSICAYSLTAAGGYHFKDAPWNPQLWVGYDHASGDDNPTDGTFRTFNQLFPFGHYYFGFFDAVGRQNIHDFSGQVTVYPTKWITAQAQFHVFRLAEARDALYNAAGIPSRRDPTGGAGTDVGQELDLLVNFHLDKHHDVLVGYSHLFVGDFIRATGSAKAPDLFYLQYTFRW